MRWSRFLWVLALISTAASGATSTSPGAIARARQFLESGVTLERLGQYQQAVDVLSQAIQSHALQGEDAGRALFDRGVAFDALGDTQRAVKDYSAALLHAPRLSAALNNRANVFRRLGRLEQAKRDYLAALHCPGVSSQYPFYGLGLIAERLGDKDTARDYFQKALAVDPSFALAAQSLSALAAPSPAISPVEMPMTPEVLSLRAPVRPVPAAVRASSALTPEDPPRKLPPISPQAPPTTEPMTVQNEHPSLRLTISDSGVRSRPRALAQIQLGAFRDEQQALEAWKKIAASSVNLLTGLQPVVLTADIPGKGRFWRLRADVPDFQAGRRICAALLEEGQACILARD